MKIDVAVIGASISGSILAANLAQAGIEVALFDKSKFPRRKACGEGVAPAGVQLLRSLGILEQLKADGAKALFGFNITRGTRVVTLPVATSAYLLGVKRETLDNLLYQRAISNGTSDHIGENVIEINLNPTLSTVITNAGHYQAKYVVLADGLNSKLLSRGNHLAPNSRYGFSIRVRTDQPPKIDLVKIVIESGFEIYCTAVDKDLFNLSFLGSRPSLSTIIRKDKFLNYLPKIFDQLHTGYTMECAALGAGPFVSSLGPPYQGSALFVGDRAHCYDPIGGQGMTHAMISALLGAEAIKESLFYGDSEEAFRNYHSNLRDESVGLKYFSWMSQKLMTSAIPQPAFNLIVRPSAFKIFDSSLRSLGRCNSDLLSSSS